MRPATPTENPAVTARREMEADETRVAARERVEALDQLGTTFTVGGIVVALVLVVGAFLVARQPAVDQWSDPTYQVSAGTILYLAAAISAAATGAWFGQIARGVSVIIRLLALQ